MRIYAFDCKAPAIHRLWQTTALIWHRFVNMRVNFPISDGDHNTKWYALYKLADSDPSVIESHKHYLLFRDIVAMSILLVPMVPLATHFSGIDVMSLKLSVMKRLLQAFQTLIPTCERNLAILSFPGFPETSFKEIDMNANLTTLENAPSKTGQKSGGGRGNNPSKK